MLVFFIALSICLVLEVGSVRVEVEQGQLEGKQVELVTKDGNYYSFKGIPYAAPPVGKLRFKAPEPPLPWKGIRNASEHGPICIQLDLLDKTKFVNASSEDCLFLNVYTPDLKPKAPLPVMFFIYGGAYESGSGNDDFYGPDFLVPHGVVLVTFNYRVEVLGFLSLDTEDAPGNAGMKDQVAALKWVKKNIAKFGGDPDNITVFGQSSGAASTLFHMLSPMSNTLFKRAIALSGVPISEWSKSYQPRRRAVILAKQLGYQEDTNDTKKLFEFLQNVEARKLAGVSPNVLASEKIAGDVFKFFYYTPVIEKDFKQERFLTDDPENILKTIQLNQKEVIIGHTSQEGIIEMVGVGADVFKDYSLNAEIFVPLQILISSPPDKVLEISDLIYQHYFGTKPITKDMAQQVLKFRSDTFYYYDIHKYVQLLTAAKTKVFEYQFSAVSGRNIYGAQGKVFNLTGASHFDDTAYLFNPNYASLPIDKNTREYKLIQQITTLYTNFAKYGNPTPDSSTISWPAYDNANQRYIDIGDTLVLGKGLDNDVAEFWDSIFQKAQS